jgi:hypothetical protein
MNNELVDDNNLLGTIWIGEVIDNNDPNFEGRLKVRVFGKYDNIKDENLPWAYHFSSINGGSNGGYGELSVPKIGNMVQVTFMNGDKLNPYWLSFPKINEKLREEISNDYIDSRTLVYDEDANLKIMYLPNTGLIFHLDESEIVINTDNSIKIEHKGTQSIIELIEDKINVTSQTEINITSNTVNATGTTTNLGTNPQYSDTMAEPLMDLLQKLAAMIDAKWPTSGSAAQGLVQQARQLIISNTVKTTLNN